MREKRRADPDRDLDTPEEIAEMVRRFYADVAQDELLGPLFNEAAQVDWSAHLPKLTAFWCRALLGISGYVGNPSRPTRTSTASNPSPSSTSSGGCRCSTRRWSSAGSGPGPTVPRSWPTTSPGCTASS